MWSLGFHVLFEIKLLVRFKGSFIYVSEIFKGGTEEKKKICWKDEHCAAIHFV